MIENSTEDVDFSLSGCVLTGWVICKLNWAEGCFDVNKKYFRCNID